MSNDKNASRELLLATLIAEAELVVVYLTQDQTTRGASAPVAEAIVHAVRVRDALLAMNTGPLAPVSPISAREAAAVDAHDTKP